MKIIYSTGLAVFATFAAIPGASADEVLSGEAAIAALSGHDLDCRVQGGGVTLEFSEATSDGRSVTYKGYFKGSYVQGVFMLNDSGNLIRKKGRVSRQVTRLSSGDLQITGQNLPKTTCKAP